ncbi:hypothetical protein [Pseudomonas canadensis]|uniref:hypothetical protein n=1 Tax=Pseudomonas canadensis TaxID=915099 RepID=UPI003BA21218
MKMMASVTALAALFGSVSAFAADENKPVDLTTTITVKNRAACSLEVTQGGSANAVVKYVKGATLEQSTISITGGESTLKVTALGGDSCDLSEIRFAYEDNAASPTPGVNFRHLLTADGTGMFPIQYNVSSHDTRDKDGEALSEDTVYSNLAQKGRRKLYKLADMRPAVSSPKTRGRVAHGKPVGTIPGVKALYDADGGAPEVHFHISALPIGVWHTDKDEEIATAPWVVRATGSKLIRTFTAGISSVPGDGFYSLADGSRSDDVVGDDESLEFKATITVTAS